MANFALILPRPEMVAQAGRIARQLGMKVVLNQYAVAEQILDVAADARKLGADIVVARGLHASILREKTDFPIAEIRLTGLEIARLLHRARSLVPHVARPRVGVVTFSNMVGNIQGFEDILGIELYIYFVAKDAEMEQEFVRNLSRESRYMRFMQSLRELTPDMLVRFTQIDYDREIAFLALAREDGHEIEVGVCRYAINPDRDSCEFALVIADAWQNRGLGGVMMQTLIEAARKKGLRTIIGEVLAENAGMLRLMQRLGFERSKSDLDDSVVIVTKRIGAGGSKI